jgi:hypothetical protein
MRDAPAEAWIRWGLLMQRVARGTITADEARELDLVRKKLGLPDGDPAKGLIARLCGARTPDEGSR